MQSVYYAMLDTLYNKSRKEDLIRLSVEYDFRAREQEANIRQQEKEEQNTLITISLTIGLLLASVIVYSLYRSNQSRKKSNAIITNQRDVLDKKQQEITESIRYARFIQQALLPPDNLLTAHLGEHFVLYLPKDIVSGDFYWFNPAATGWLVAVADCTGHGVPGAFMSLLAKENLDKASTQEDAPGTVLAKLNRAIRNSLQQGVGEQRGLTLQDGLDIALLKKNGNSIVYAGANRPLLIYRNATGAIEDFKPTKASIGGTTPDDQIFQEHKIDVHKGDIIYMFSDGFPDQFGGQNKKKLTTKKFRELLHSIAKHPIQKQHDELRQFITRWRGEEEQIDDVLVIGIRVS